MLAQSFMPFVIAPLLAAACVSCAATLIPAAPAITPAGVRFVVRDAGARSVALAGSFNQWSTSSHPLTRERSSGLWSLVVRLPAGEHLFMYVVDGRRWMSPPLAEEYADDGFGAKNGVVIVRPLEE